MTSLHRLVYVSRTTLPDHEPQIAEAVEQILAASQRNNARVGVTGALMFNRGAFAQVLEGPREAVEATFERIQRDPRHGEVNVLQCAPVAARGFTDWSMAFIGQSARGRALWGGIAALSGFDPARLDGDEVFSMLHGLILDEEGPTDAAEAAPTMPAADPAEEPPGDLDPRAQLRHLATSLRAALPGEGAYAEALRDARAAPETGPGREGGALLSLELSIVRKALRAERTRMADMAARIEELQAAVIAGEQRAEHLRRGRDLWAERARLLAMPVFQGLAKAAAEREADGASAAPSLRSVA